MKLIKSLLAALAVATSILLYTEQSSLAGDIFASPVPSPTPDINKYSTSAAFLAATRNGEIPGILKDWTDTRRTIFGKAVLTILKNEYHVSMPELRFDTPLLCGLILSNVTQYQLNGAKDGRLKDVFQHNRDTLAGNLKSSAFMAAFDSFLKKYQEATVEFVQLEQEQDVKAQVEEDERERRNEIVERQRQAEIDKLKARARDEKAEADAQTAIEKKAMADQEALRVQQLEAAKKSPEYLLWTEAREVEFGLKMIADGQKVLDDDDSVVKESGVSNLTQRRSAGERIVQGKRIVSVAFKQYCEHGGSAVKPEDVHAGPDPSAQYR